MELELRINGVIKSLDVAPNESLLTVLRQEGYFSVKRGCETGECGACTVLVDGIPRPSCVLLAAQSGGCTLTTVESLGSARKLHPLQEAFIDTGAIACGFCTPGMLLSASALLQSNPNPTEDEVREALSGNLCRCTGYVKPMQAVLRATAILRGETVTPINCPNANETPNIIGKPERKIDAIKLVTGKPVFVNDIEVRDMLHARLLTSPHAHAVIRHIDTSKARTLPGVHAVLTCKDVPRIPYNTAAVPSYPEPGPYDQYCLDDVVRFVGDRVAAVAAETPEIAEQALSLINVNYEVLPAILDSRQALAPSAPSLHPEAESHHIHNAKHNIAAHLEVQVGNVERGFAEADLVVEREYTTAQVQQVPLENHVVITHWDEDNRLVVRTGTSAPHQVRRIIAPLIGLPPYRIHVMQMRSGGDFGAKQDMLLEDICALLTITTNRPVKLALSCAEEFRSSRARHAQVIRMKTGVKRDGTIVANQMAVLANTGAYGTHALAVQRNTATQTLPLYPCPNVRFVADAVYTNLPPAGASGVSQGRFALESHLDEIARQLGMDPLALRRRNWLKEGDANLLIQALNVDEEGPVEIVKSCGLPQCLQIVEEKLNWQAKRGKGGNGRFRSGVGIALAMHSTMGGMSGASIKLNDDGTFNLLIGSGDNGSGSHTIIAQLAAEVLGVRVEDILIHSSDTDSTPFTTGADNSAVTYASSGATQKAAEQVRRQILAVAGRMLKADPDTLTLSNRLITAPDGQAVTVSEVALHALYVENLPIIATASWASFNIPPSFAVQGAEVEVDSETGLVRVLKAISAVDAECVVNPLIAEGQIEGGTTQSLGCGTCEEMIYDAQGRLLTDNLNDYHIYNTVDMPAMQSYLVETPDPSSPFGIKPITEIAMDGMAPAIANAVSNALGIHMRQLPLTPERILRAIHMQGGKR